LRTSNREQRGRGPSRRGGGRRDGGSSGGSGGRGGGRSRKPVEPLHPTEDPPDIQSFREWKLEAGVLDAIEAMGIVKPTPIQALATQPVLDGRDVIAKAETGTGKTLAFGAPMVSRVDADRVSVLGLVLCPTRELAQQVAKVLEEIGKPRGISVALIVGGEPMEPQVKALHAGSQIVVGTPGRILDLHNQKFLSFPWTEFAVLDEADTMLEIGFIDDIKKILSLMPDERQTLLFSATFPPELLTLAREYTRDPVEVATASGVATVDTIEQSWITLDDEERALALTRLIEQSGDDDVFLVFCERRTSVDRLMRRLERLPYGIKALHGGYDQASRFRVMSAFRTGEVKALVATDVASRGLDVNHVTHVVNYAVPSDVTAYTHRIGRTGRAGRKGNAISFVIPADRRRWNSILNDANWEIPETDPPSPSRGRGRRQEGGRSGRPQARDEGGRGGRTQGRDEGGSGRRTQGRDERRRERDEDRSPRGAARARFGGQPRLDEEKAGDQDRAPRQRGDERSPERSPERAAGGRGRGGDRPGRDAERSSGRARSDSAQPDRAREAKPSKPAQGDAPGFGAGTESAPKPERAPRREKLERDDSRRAPKPERDESRRAPKPERDESRRAPKPERDESRRAPKPERDDSRRAPKPERDDSRRAPKKDREPREDRRDTPGLGGFGSGL